MLFCFVAVPLTQGDSQRFTPKKETLTGPVYGAPFGALWSLLGGLVQSRVNASVGSPGAGAQGQEPPSCPAPSPTSAPALDTSAPGEPQSSPAAPHPLPRARHTPRLCPSPGCCLLANHAHFPPQRGSFLQGLWRRGAAQNSGPASGPSRARGATLPPVLQLLHPNLQNIPAGAPSSVPAPNQPEPTLAPGHPHPSPVPRGLLGLPGGRQAVVRGTC